ncbi:helix-turn-helix domain-containing protein [Tautonia plasticadhaerens]|uniref:Transcriptional regulator n=1 Tax=Tautonia plasticadhaerens TaxID=2527974 RepID=A0A518HFN5_9BACT|nr:transcriptional regulator [Tautonia plasticadhaerens]QDV39659.1 hypothetical protein ElP_76310 [Tautonia plasticadhaerens]
MATAATSHDRDPYFELVRRLPLRPIRSDDELDRAIAMVDELVIREDIAPGVLDYLDVLSDLVHKYEAAEHPIPPATDAEVHRFLMDSRGLNQSQLAAEVEDLISYLE